MERNIYVRVFISYLSVLETENITIHYNIYVYTHTYILKTSLPSTQTDDYEI